MKRRRFLFIDLIYTTESADSPLDSSLIIFYFFYFSHFFSSSCLKSPQAENDFVCLSQYVCRLDGRPVVRTEKCLFLSRRSCRQETLFCTPLITQVEILLCSITTSTVSMHFSSNKTIRAQRRLLVSVSNTFWSKQVLTHLQACVRWKQCFNIAYSALVCMKTHCGIIIPIMYI